MNDNVTGNGDPRRPQQVFPQQGYPYPHQGYPPRPPMSPTPPRKPWKGAFLLGIVAGLVLVAVGSLAIVWAVKGGDGDSSGGAVADGESICAATTASLAQEWGLETATDIADADADDELGYCALQNAEGTVTMVTQTRHSDPGYQDPAEWATNELDFACGYNGVDESDTACHADIENLADEDAPYGYRKVVILDDGETLLYVTMNGPTDSYDDMVTQVESTVEAFDSGS